MKSLMDAGGRGNEAMQGLAKIETGGNCEMLADRINGFLLSVSSELPKLNETDYMLKQTEEIPDMYVISVEFTLNVLKKLKVNKAMEPGNVPAWILKM